MAKPAFNLPSAHNEAIIPIDVTTLGMLQRAFNDGTAGQTAIFELQASQLPQGHKYGVVAGVRQAVESLTNGTVYPYTETEVSPEVGKFLAKFRFSGTVTAYPDGTFWFPGSPVVTIVAPLVEALTILPLFASTVTAASSAAGEASALRRVVGGETQLQVNLTGVTVHNLWIADAILTGGVDVTDSPLLNQVHECWTAPVLNLPVLTPWTPDEAIIFDEEVADLDVEEDDDPFGWDEDEDVEDAGSVDEVASLLEQELSSVTVAGWDSEETVASAGWTVVDATREDMWLRLPELARAGEQVSLRGVSTLKEFRQLRNADILPPHIQVDVSFFTQAAQVAFRFRLIALDNDQTIPNKPRTAWREYGANWKPVREHVLHFEAPKPGWIEQQHPFILQGRTLPLEAVTEADQRHRQQLEGVPSSLEVRVDGNQMVWRLANLYVTAYGQPR